MVHMETVKFMGLLQKLTEVKEFLPLAFPLSAKTILAIELGFRGYYEEEAEKTDNVYCYYPLVKSARGFSVILHDNVFVAVPKNKEDKVFLIVYTGHRFGEGEAFVVSDGTWILVED